MFTRLVVKLYINSRKYARIGMLLMLVIQLGTLFPYLHLSSKTDHDYNYPWITLPIAGLVCVLLIERSRFLYRTLERTNASTLTFYTNLFGYKLNALTIVIDSVDGIRVYQDLKNYFILELHLKNGTTYHLGRFTVRSRLAPFEQLAKELIKM